MTARILKRRGGGGGFYNADGVTLKVDILHIISQQPPAITETSTLTPFYISSKPISQ